MAKQAFTSAILLLGMISCIYSQDKNPIIMAISQKAEAIDSIENYEILSLQNEEFLDQMTDGGSQLEAYLKNDSIYKIRVEVGLSYGVLKTEYYYWEETLIFAHQQEKVFKHIYHAADTAVIDLSPAEAYELIESSEKSYYFQADTLVGTKEKGESLFGNETAKEAVEDIYSSSKELLMIIKNRR